MSSIETYRAALAALSAADWEPYLLAHSNLPGPRGNLELAQAVADEGTEAQFRRWASLGSDVAPENTPQCFLTFCGVVGLGTLLARSAGRGEAHLHASSVTDDAASDAELPVAAGAPGNVSPLRLLRPRAADPRWRIREAVAMALQRWGDADMAGLLAAMAEWARKNAWAQRAAAAALCEPRLLTNPEHAAAVLGMLDAITARILTVPRSSSGQSRAAGQNERRSEAFKALRQSLGYCWSVAVVALPDAGKPLMEKWLASPDPDVRWIMLENLKKNRLVKMDAKWVGALARSNVLAF
jgi:hypothetical protein